MYVKDQNEMNDLDAGKNAFQRYSETLKRIDIINLSSKFGTTIARFAFKSIEFWQLIFFGSLYRKN